MANLIISVGNGAFIATRKLQFVLLKRLIDKYIQHTT